MAHSRRVFLKTIPSAMTLAAMPTVQLEASTIDAADTPDEIVGMFERLPGDKAFKILVPALSGKPKLQIQFNSDRVLFVASAMKTFALCERLRQLDSPNVVDKLEQNDLALNSTVWSLGSPTFNPPNLRGIVHERAVMEAMITSSDNTATDMIFKAAGVDRIRAFIRSAGLARTRIPDSTRIFSGYLFGADNYKTIGWQQLVNLANEGVLVHPFLNDVQTMASCPDDFVSYYSRALRGNFFQHRETLSEYRRILTLCDFIYLVPLPLASAYAKSGNVDFPGFHARSIAGGLFSSGRWIFFAFVINWYSEEGQDPNTISRFFSAIHRSLTIVMNSM
jgi:beta-lactamase class A